MYSFDNVLTVARNNHTNGAKKGPTAQQAEFLQKEIDQINSPGNIVVPSALSKTGWKRITADEYHVMQDRRAKQGSGSKMAIYKPPERNAVSTMHKTTYNAKMQFMTTN